MGEALNSIKEQQRKWAGGKNISPKGYCRKLQDNLFQKLDEDTRHDFEEADGGELYGKMNAVHSSSALACNFFDYWRDVEDSSPLADALEFHAKIHNLKFEGKFNNGVSRIPPNLDVVLTRTDQTLLAIESKFTEPFSGSKNKKYLKDEYFSGCKKRWSKLGLSDCQKLAADLRQEHCYKYLDAAQLLKHMLGLANCGKNWELLYLWFNPGGPEAECHEDEIQQFIGEVSRDGGKVGGGGAIRAMTYQELFDNLSQRLNAAHKRYKDYLVQRYFPEE